MIGQCQPVLVDEVCFSSTPKLQNRLAMCHYTVVHGQYTCDHAARFQDVYICVSLCLLIKPLYFQRTKVINILYHQCTCNRAISFKLCFQNVYVCVNLCMLRKPVFPVHPSDKMFYSPKQVYLIIEPFKCFRQFGKPHGSCKQLQTTTASFNHYLSNSK